MAQRGRECSIANALSVVGERWSLLALREIMLGARRFDEIARNTGASRDILADRLRTLAGYGVLTKVLYEQHPPRYEYVPTEAGQALRPILVSFMDWGDRYLTEGPAPTVLQCRCGSELHPVTVCRHCGEPVEGGYRILRLGKVPADDAGDREGRPGRQKDEPMWMPR